jgi:hypothetical protein
VKENHILATDKTSTSDEKRIFFRNNIVRGMGIIGNYKENGGITPEATYEEHMKNVAAIQAGLYHLAHATGNPFENGAITMGDVDHNSEIPKDGDEHKKSVQGKEKTSMYNYLLQDYGVNAAYGRVSTHNPEFNKKAYNGVAQITNFGIDMRGNWIKKDGRLDWEPVSGGKEIKVLPSGKTHVLFSQMPKQSNKFGEMSYG